MTDARPDPGQPPDPAIETLFAEYLDRPAAERDAWLTHACRGDAARIALIRHLAGFAGTPSSGETVMPEDLPSDAIPGMQLRGTLGAGAMGDVLIAYEEEPGRFVAVKVLKRMGTASGLLDRFRREITALATLDDPGIVRILRSGVLDRPEGQRPWFSMELVRDARPITAAARAQSWPTARCVRAIRDAARALHGAHSRGLVHGDLAPGNVLIDAEGRVRLIDFGIARWIHEAGEPAPLATLTVAAPEQLAGRAFDHQADVHALGALLAWLVTGEPPRRAANGSVLPPHEALADEPDLLAVIARAVSVDPADRHATAAAFADDLDAVLEHQPLSWRSESVTQRLRRLWRQDPRTVVIGSALVMVLLVLVVGASWAAGAFAERAAQAEADRRTAILQLAEQNLEVGAVSQARTLLARRGRSDGSLEERIVVARLARASDTILEHPGHVYRVACPAAEPFIYGELGGAVVRIDAIGTRHDLLARNPAGSPDAEAIDLAPLAPDRLGIMYSDGSWCVIDPLACTVIGTHGPDGAIAALRAAPAAGAFLALTPTAVVVTDRDGAHPRSVAHGGSGTLRAFAVAPDGRSAAVGGIQGELTIVPLDGGEPRRTTLPGSRLWSIAYAPDGRRLALGSRDGGIRLVDSSSLDVLHARRLHATELTWLDWSPDGSRIATCGSDQRVHVVDGISLEAMHDLPTTLGRPWCLAWSGESLVIAEQGGVERVAPDTPPLARVGDSRPILGADDAWACSWRWDNDVVIRNPDGSVLRRWDLRDQGWSSPWPPVVAIGPSADRRSILAGGSRGRLLRLDPLHAEPVESIDTSAVAEVFGAVAEVGPGGDLVIGGMDGHLMRINRACTMTRWETDRYAFEPESIIVDQPTGRVVAAWRDGRIAVHRLDDGALVLDARLTPLRTNRIQRDAEGRLVVDADRGRFILAGP
jgi:hypothetical protein